MTRRFEIGPVIVALASLVLLVGLFLDWYGNQSAWDTFELADVLLAALALVALAAAAGLLAPALASVDRRWLPASVVAIAVVVVAEILSPPLSVGGADPQQGAWLAFGASIAMLVGAVLSVGRVSFSVAVEGRQHRHRVAAVDHRPPTTEGGAVVGAREDETDVTEPVAPPPGGGKKR
jgi:hypothetical protein